MWLFGLMRRHECGGLGFVGHENLRLLELHGHLVAVKHEAVRERDDAPAEGRQQLEPAGADVAFNRTTDTLATEVPGQERQWGNIRSMTAITKRGGRERPAEDRDHGEAEKDGVERGGELALREGVRLLTTVAENKVMPA